MSNEKINSRIKLSNNSSFAILIFVISKFRNIGRSTFEHSKFCTPPAILKFQNIGCFTFRGSKFSPSPEIIDLYE